MGFELKPTKEYDTDNAIISDGLTTVTSSFVEWTLAILLLMMKLVMVIASSMTLLSMMILCYL